MRRLAVVLAGLAWASAAGADEPPPTVAPAPPVAPVSPDGAPPVVVTPPPTPAEQDSARKDVDKPPEPLPPPDPIAGFVKGQGFRLQSPDGHWRLRVGLQAAASYQPQFVTPTGEDTTSNWSQFKVPYARLRVDGNLFRKWIRYWFSFEFASYPPFLLDGYVEAQPWNFFGIRLGQMFTPISWHEYLGPQELVFPDWAVVADYFWTGRDKGIQVFGETPRVDYYVGFYAGTPLKVVATIPGHFQFMGRVTIHPLGALGYGEIPYIVADGHVPLRFSFSLQGYWNKITPSSVGFNPTDGVLQMSELGERKQEAGAADFLFEWERLFFYAEFYARHVDILDNSGIAPFWQYGAWAQLHYTFYRRILDAALRFNWINPDKSLANDQYFSGEAQVAYFPAAQYVNLKLRYAVAHQQDPGASPALDPALLSELPLPYSPGTAHLVTIQASVYF